MHSGYSPVTFVHGDAGTLEAPNQLPAQNRRRTRPTRDDGGRISGFVALVTDITETKTIERALRRSERLLKQSQAAAQVGSWEVTFDEKQAVVEGSYFWSSETYRIFGVEPSTPVTLSLFYSHVHPDERPAMQDQRGNYLERAETFESEYRIVRTDGSVRTLHGWLNFDRGSDATTHVSGTVQDITDRKHAEMEIQRALNDLREADRRKDEFLAMLSHELRNPLGPILNAVEVLEQLGPSDQEIAAECRDMIARQAKHMKRLLDDLLDLSRVSEGKIQLQKQRVDLNVLLGQAVEISRPMMIEKRHEVSLDLLPQPLALEADPTRLLQVFGNLLNNAAKYTDPGGHIAIVAAVEDGDAVVTVRDDGIGMTPDLLERAFDLFVQGTRALDRAQGGLGIGLTLVQTLVRMHGGSVRAFSGGPGRGSELLVRLPLAPPAE
jgi:PAS domain S-box-containing protein